MALAATAAAAALAFSSHSFPKPFPLAIRPPISISAPPLLLNSYFSSLLPLNRISSRSLRFQLCSGVQEIAVEGEEETQQRDQEEVEQKEKLYVANLPWNFSATDIENLFGQCGTVRDVEIIKQKNGRSRGFAFITVGSVEEARTAIDKFDAYELLGRIIRVAFAKSLKKPSPPPADVPVGETQHKIYVSNLAWKARSNNLREFFSASFKPVSTRVIFDSPSGKSAGYGFVSFATKEEAESAISELDGKELMGRPLRLKISQSKGDESGSKAEVEDGTEGNVEGS